MTPEDKAEIKKVISEALREGSCACRLSPSAQAEVSHFMGMVKDLGDGNRGAGIESMRDMLKWWSRVRATGEKIGVGIIVAVAASIAGGIGTLIWLGLKTRIGE